MNTAKPISKHADVSKGTFAADVTVSECVGAILATFTSAYQRMVEYMLVNPFRAAAMRIDEFAAAADISVTTTDCSALALGFDGYPQFRAGLLRGLRATLASVGKLRHELTRPASNAEIFAVSFNEDIVDLDATHRMLDAAACERMVNAILGAQHIYVMGFGASGYLAGLPRYGLDLYYDTVIVVPQPGSASGATRQLRKIGPKDLLIATTFLRYVADTITLTKQADKRGCQLLALADSPTSPLMPSADIALHARPGRQFSATSGMAAVVLFETLCGTVAHRSAYSLESAEHLTELVLSWLRTAPVSRTNDAPGVSGTPVTTRRDRKRATENQLTSSHA